MTDNRRGMLRVVEQVAAGILDLLSRADSRMIEYHRKRRGEMGVVEADRGEIESAIATRAELRRRNAPARPDDVPAE